MVGSPAVIICITKFELGLDASAESGLQRCSGLDPTANWWPFLVVVVV